MGRMWLMLLKFISHTQTDSWGLHTHTQYTCTHPLYILCLFSTSQLNMTHVSWAPQLVFTMQPQQINEDLCFQFHSYCTVIKVLWPSMLNLTVLHCIEKHYAAISLLPSNFKRLLTWAAVSPDQQGSDSRAAHSRVLNLSTPLWGRLQMNGNSKSQFWAGTCMHERLSYFHFWLQLC